MNLRKRLHEDGFLHLKNFFSKKEVDLIYSEVTAPFKALIEKKKINHNQSLKLNQKEGMDRGLVALFDESIDSFIAAAKIAQQSPSLYSLCGDQKVRDLLNQIGCKIPSVCGKPCVFFNSKKTSEKLHHYKTPVHQDWYSMQGSIPSFVFWAPLMNVNKEHGALRIIPGSHTDGLFEVEENEWFFHLKSDQYDEKAFLDVEMKLGDLLVFDSFLVHESGMNTSDMIRWSVQFRFNDLLDESFVEREFPYPYISRPTKQRVYSSEYINELCRDK